MAVSRFWWASVRKRCAAAIIDWAVASIAYDDSNIVVAATMRSFATVTRRWVASMGGSGLLVSEELNMDAMLLIVVVCVLTFDLIKTSVTLRDSRLYVRYWFTYKYVLLNTYCYVHDDVLIL